MKYSIVLVRLILVLIAFISVVVGIIRYRKKIEEEEDLSNYSKDENGLYPWESDTDDSPSRISDDAKRYVNVIQKKKK
ncbi:hypothetical protein BG261_11000 [Floricoccus tropicus]|uniref:Uncharacterized protein n=1 Tax=Floricoccus tropicus TaxID=1859473 RepID=A0A1E8GLY9_9LACT|nr:hypothetical protein BG261_11000 [Floricoccus tropicus]